MHYILIIRLTFICLTGIEKTKDLTYPAKDFEKASQDFKYWNDNINRSRMKDHMDCILFDVKGGHRKIGVKK